MKMLWPVAASLLLAISGCSKASSDAPAANSANQATASDFVSTPIQDISGNAPESVRKAITEHLKIADLPAHITAIVPTEMPNLYWVTFREVPPVFISGDGKFLLQGDLNKLGNGTVTNLTEALNAQETKRQLTAFPEKEMIIFSPASKPKAVIYAFTDVDCGYCRKMHSEINQVTAKGIEVRYIPWPRSEEDVAKNKAVWCSEDRQSAFTTATSGLSVQAPVCDDPVMNGRRVGMIVGVNGTPAIYDANGKYLGGYIPANQLAKILKIDSK
ncbi:MAG: DsbC family protein [Gammaproteobacteria bacterium]|nr:DsbC family protein [Gammaproteobacteria bacterium]